MNQTMEELQVQSKPLAPIRRAGGLLAAFGCSMLIGCATTTASMQEDAAVFERETVAPVAAAASGSTAATRDGMDERDARIADLERRLAAATGSPVADDLFPPDARPGQCWARVLVPARYRTWEEQVLTRQASERVEVIPARYEMAKERVLVREAETRLEVIPATFRSVTEEVLVKPESVRIEEVAATYKTVTERVLDKPAHTIWKKGPPTLFGDKVVSSSVNGTGEVMCLVEVPATYRTITRTDVDVPAHTREIKIPAEYKTVTRKVIDRPASTREVVIPEEYRSVEVRRLVSKASERRIAIPEEYRTVSKTEKVAEETMSWQQVLCEVNATSENVRRLQRALGKAGYEVEEDGVLGPDTIRAVNRYASSRNIPYGDNYVPVDVLKGLNVRI